MKAKWHNSEILCENWVEMVRKAYRYAALSFVQVYWWDKAFEKGREGVEHEQQLGHRVIFKNGTEFGGSEVCFQLWFESLLSECLQMKQELLSEITMKSWLRIWTWEMCGEWWRLIHKFLWFLYYLFIVLKRNLRLLVSVSWYKNVLCKNWMGTWKWKYLHVQ